MVFEEPTTWSGDGRWRNASTSLGEQLSRVRAQSCHLRFGGRVVGQELDGRATRAEGHRACDVGYLVDALCELERAAADVEEQDVVGRPPVPAPHGEEGEVAPRLRRGAPAVRRRSRGRPGRAPLRRWRPRGWPRSRRARNSSMPDSRAIAAASPTAEMIAATPSSLIAPSGSRYRMSRSTDLWDDVGDRPRPAMGVDDEEVHGVGSDVENTEAHTASVAVVVHNDATGTTVPLRSAVASRGAP